MVGSGTLQVRAGRFTSTTQKVHVIDESAVEGEKSDSKKKERNIVCVQWREKGNTMGDLWSDAVCFVRTSGDRRKQGGPDFWTEQKSLRFSFWKDNVPL